MEYAMKLKVKTVLIVIILSPFITACGCIFVIIFQYDYGYLFHKNANWSDFSLLDTPEDVKNVLEENLLIGESTLPDVVTFLSQMKVNSCILSQDRQKPISRFSPREIDDNWNYEWANHLSCSTIAHETIIDHSNPLNIRASYVLCDWLYLMNFHFNQGILIEIETEETCAGGL